MPYRGPGIYGHYKGPLYEVLGLSLHEHSKDHNPEFNPANHQQQFVVYRPLSPGGLLDGEEPDFWLRARTVFDEDVTVGEKSVPRFTFRGTGGHNG